MTTEKLDSIAACLRAPEGERLERTRAMDFAGLKEKLGKTLCAFANDLAEAKTLAHFLIGVTDDGKLSGYRYRDADEQRICNWLKDGLIRPEINARFTKLQSEAGDILIIGVASSAQAPHRFDKKIWVRQGNTTHEAGVAEENRLHEARRYRAGLSYDASLCPQASLDDIDLEAFYAYRALVVPPETIEVNHRSLAAQLAALNLFDLANYPTVVGLVCFGQADERGNRRGNRRGLAGGAGVVQFIRVNGTERGDPVLHSAELCLSLYATRERIDALLAAHTTKREEVIGLEKNWVSSYPEKALRELVFNAIAHRDYTLASPIQIYWFNDRVEIQSPGGLFPPSTVDNFQLGVPSRRNPVITDIMRELRMVERSGSGIATVNSQLKKMATYQRSLRRSVGRCFASR